MQALTGTSNRSRSRRNRSEIHQCLEAIRFHEFAKNAMASLLGSSEQRSGSKYSFIVMLAYAEHQRSWRSAMNPTNGGLRTATDR